MIEPRFRWILPPVIEPSADLRQAAAAAGIGERALPVLVARGVTSATELESFLAPALAGLHDPMLLPDADRLVARIAAARREGERVLVFGDFDADGLTGLAILVTTFRRLGLEAIPYVPSRLEEGHGLSLAAVDAAASEGATLIVTVDTGSSSGAEVAVAGARGIDVIVTDHHRVPPDPPMCVAFVNPHRPDAVYPDRRLAGSGVAFKVAQLLLADQPAAALELADLATVGTVADLAPIMGENRAIARLGLDRLRSGSRPGLAALLASAGVAPASADLETVAFAVAPRLNAAGRVGEAMDAARLLLAVDPAEAAAAAATLEAANITRRDLTRTAVAEARASADSDGSVVLAHGPWPVGIVGLVAAKLSEESGRPAIVGAELGPVIRASCRSGPGTDLAGLLAACGDLLIRHGGHSGAAGFEVAAGRWDDLAERLRSLATPAAPGDGRPSLTVDLALPARSIDYALVGDLSRLAPFGPGNPDPLVAIDGLTVARVRPANGGHTQLVLRRQPDVLDGIAFGRDDLVGSLAEGQAVEIVARVVSRRFGGIESLQLEVRDVAPAGHLASAAAAGAGVTPRALQASGA